MSWPASGWIGPALAALILPGAAGFPGMAGAQAVNDFPTAARAEYVLACMASNGETPEALQRCSCAIDSIASVLPYDRYVSAETVLRMQQTSGDRSAVFRGGAMMDGIMADLRRAEAEAEVLCF